MDLGKDPRKQKTEDITDRAIAINHFTDRREALAAFQAHLDAPEGQPLPVLQFFGVGGIGKSLLLEKLRNDLSETEKRLPVAAVDFRNERDRHRLRALTLLRVALGRHGLQFPEFDLVRAVLDAAEGGQEADLISISPWYKAAFSALQLVPLASPLSALETALGHAATGLRTQYPGLEEWLRRLGGTKEVLLLQGLGRNELSDRLLEAFAGDLTEGSPARPGKAVQAVLLMDTYEALWTGRQGPTGPQGALVDDWIRDLYCYLRPGGRVLLVLAGRDRLAWADPQVDPDWASLKEAELRTHLETHLIGGLSAADTQRYLSRRGVGHPPETGEPSPLQAAIIDGCSGGELEKQGCLPLYVRLCADIVLNERGPGGRGADPPPEWFHGIPNDQVAYRLANRFLTSLGDDATSNLVKALSFARWFDLPLVKDRLEVGPDAAAATFRRLTASSFCEAAQDGRVRLHVTMRAALKYLVSIDQRDRLTPEDLHAWFRQHWQARHEAGEAAAEVEAWYHHLHLAPEEAFGIWCAHVEAARDRRDGPRARDLIDWWEGIDLTDADWQERLGDGTWAATVHNLAYRLHELRPFAWAHSETLQRVIACYEAALRVYTEEAFPTDWARTQHNLGLACWELPTGDRARNLQRAIACYEAALRVYTEEAFPTDWAMTQNSLAIAYWDLPTGDRPRNLQRAIDGFQAALRVRTEEAFPTDWARVQNNLGNAYSDLPTGDRAQNVLRAIACYEVALRVYTGEAFPTDWAATQHNLGLAYQDLPTGDRAENLQRAIACYEAALRVRTEEAFPADWAMTQNNLGSVYQSLPAGDRAQNLQRAIDCYEAALRVCTEEAFPTDWAITQNNLGSVYQSVPTGDRAGNLQRAIDCYEAALRVRTEEAFPTHWAMTQDNLGTAYADLPSGDRAENLQRAIDCYEAALRVYTEGAFPTDWARTQYNLGNAYADLPTDDRAQNLQRAIACYEAALRVYTEGAFPTDWAMTQNNLGSAYRSLPTGDRAQNLQRAIDCYEAALRVRTEEAFPTHWAMTQNSLGTAYADLPTGGRAENLQRAIDCYEAALRVYTEGVFPTDWAIIQNNLGNAYSDLPTGDRAENLQRAIVCYEAALRVRTEEAFPTDWARTSHNLASAHGIAGDFVAGIEVLSPVAAAQPGDGDAAYLLACLLALQGQAEEALEHLARAIGLDGQRYRSLATEDGDFASLREDPRFQALVAEPTKDDG
ncbi:tetratricopeptide repeat protein [bacterium]|nr:tetratricopeptide repeat protein [bacterium]